MTIKEAYHLFRSKLISIYSENESENISRMIFESTAKITRSDLLLYPNKILEEQTNNKLKLALDELLDFKPVQYVIGHCWFYHLSFKVNDKVLIPRPETEELVMKVIHWLNNNPAQQLLDIGTGSGCIPIAIKKNKTDISITSVDISLDALFVAKENAIHNETEINFIELDFLNSTHWSKLGKYDVIVSNPPYIPNDEFADMENNVKLFEPASALFVPDTQPLIFYEKIAEFCKEHLSEKGIVFLEIHENKGKEVCELFLEKGFQTELKKDMYEKNRIVIVTRNQ